MFAALALCACDINFFLCEPASPDTLAALPEMLSESGIDDPAVREYAPQYELWSDDAKKRRWLAIPDGQTIDTSDPDSWRFPLGTSVWKEFSLQGIRLETRLIRKIGRGDFDWAAISYVWNDDQNEAFAAPLGQLSTLQTAHNVPAAGECVGCHGGRRSWLLGVSALQLAYDDGDDNTVELADLDRLGVLSDAVTVDFTIPGDRNQVAALGYMHANCGHCHNSARPPRARARCFEPKNDLDFWLRSDSLESFEQTTTMQSVRASDTVKPGNPGGSDLIDRVNRRGFIYQMPPLGTEEIDHKAVVVLKEWIRQL